MPVLSEKAEAVCVAYIQHGDGSKAYRDAGYAPNAKPETVAKLVNRFLKRAEVQKRLSELRDAVSVGSNITLQSHLAELGWLMEISAASGKMSAAVQASIARGKVVGLYIDRVAVSGSLDVTEKPDLTKLSEGELTVLQAMLEKAGMAAHTLQ